MIAASKQDTRLRIVHTVTVPLSLVPYTQQLKYMQRRGIEMHAISSPGEEWETLKKHVTAHKIPMRRAISPLHDLVALGRLCRTLLQIKPHVVHAHTPKAGLLGMLAAVLTRVPVRIYLLRGLRFQTTRGARRLLLKTCEWLACRSAHRVLCVSRSLRELAIKEKIVRSAKIVVLANGSSNGVDSESRFNPRTIDAASRDEMRRRYQIPDDGIVLGFVGRLVREKGIVELIQAWQTLREEYPKLYLLLVGWFESQDALPHPVTKVIREDPRIRFVGRQWETPPLYQLMDIFCLPTYREGLAMALLEACAMELAVVATRVPGCVDAVEDGVTATLTPPQDVQAMIAAIRRYVDDPQWRIMHGKAARTRVMRDFAPTKVWQGVFEEYVRQARRHPLS